MSDARIEIGRVRSVNPARREVRVTPRRGYERALNGLREIEFAMDRGQRQTVAVETVEEQERCVKLTLAQGTSPDAVAALKSAKVLGEPGVTAAADPFRMDAAKFAGFAVVDMDGNAVGVVSGGFTTPAHGVIEIARHSATRVLAPFVPEVIAHIDEDARVIVLRDIEAHLAEQDGGDTMA